jgi:hypothetical protein
VTWLALWVVKGRPRKLTMFELLTIPEEAFEYHWQFYAGDDEAHPIATMHRSRGGWFAGDEYFTYHSSHGKPSASLPEACKNLWEGLRIHGVPAWYGKVVERRARKPGRFNGSVRRRP